VLVCRGPWKGPLKNGVKGNKKDLEEEVPRKGKRVKKARAVLRSEGRHFESTQVATVEGRLLRRKKVRTEKKREKRF